jgi:GNAT superfamily N-acetyltransferase
MIELRQAAKGEAQLAMDIIDMAKKHLKQQNIDQWQSGYPDFNCIEKDIAEGKGYFITDKDTILGYLCIDFAGEPAYETLKGTWKTEDKYVVVHRMAFTDDARGRGISSIAFKLVENLSKMKGITSFRIDTDSNNHKMQHILQKNGFEYRGPILFDNSEKIAFDKIIV